MTNFLNISNSFQEMVQTVYSSTQYLSTSYVDLFMADLNNNISDRVNSSRVDSKIYLGTPNYVNTLNKYNILNQNFLYSGNESCCLKIF